MDSGRFHMLTIVHNAAMKTGVHIFFRASVLESHVFLALPNSQGADGLMIPAFRTSILTLSPKHSSFGHLTVFRGELSASPDLTEGKSLRHPQISCIILMGFPSLSFAEGKHGPPSPKGRGMGK